MKAALVAAVLLLSISTARAAEPVITETEEGITAEYTGTADDKGGQKQEAVPPLPVPPPPGAESPSPEAPPPESSSPAPADATPPSQAPVAAPDAAPESQPQPAAAPAREKEAAQESDQPPRNRMDWRKTGRPFRPQRPPLSGTPEE